MLRVLFNTPSPTLQGGLATCVPLLQNGLEPYVQIKTFQHGGVSDEERVVRKCARTAIGLAVTEYKILRCRPDVIHVNSAFNERSILRDTPLAMVAAGHGIPLLLMVHGSFPEVIERARNGVELAKRVLIRSLSLLCVLSQAEKDEFESLLPQLRGRVRVVKNVIAEQFLDTPRHESSEPIVLFASRFVEKKGPFQLLKAVPLITTRLPKARFVFLGDGPEAARFDQEVRDRLLGTVVRRLPYAGRDEIAGWYGRAWVLAFPTFFAEGMPMVVAEAMATGTPIVTTRTRFCRSHTTEYVHCLSCDPEDPESIARQILKLLTDSALRQRMSQANRVFAKQFRQDVVAREFLELYEQLAGVAARPSTAHSPSELPHTTCNLRG